MERGREGDGGREGGREGERDRVIGRERPKGERVRDICLVIVTVTIIL